jgi:N-acetylmuramoyl-L-alanine amidase
MSTNDAPPSAQSGQPYCGSSAPSAWVSSSSSTTAATLTVGELAVALLVGFLDPIDQRSGVEARLSNLGYYTGAVGAEDDDQFRFALQLFQAAEGLRVTGENDTATRARLKDVYGC